MNFHVVFDRKNNNNNNNNNDNNNNNNSTYLWRRGLSFITNCKRNFNSDVPYWIFNKLNENVGYMPISQIDTLNFFR